MREQALTAGSGSIAQPAFQGAVDYNGLRVWPLGDSITWGTADGPTENIGCGYRDRLYALLAAAGHERVACIGSQSTGYNCATCQNVPRALLNDGHAGFTTLQLNTNFAAYLAAAGTPDVILIHAGTNDLISDNANAIANFNTLITTVTAALGKLTRYFIAQLVPHLIGGAVTTAAFNVGVAARVATLASQGFKVNLVDMYTALLPAPSVDFSVGNVHPNAAGYTKMAATWFAAMMGAT